ncbi:hypothetical protein MTX36_29455, partial [Rhodococcus sp. ARC_M6]
MPSSAERTGPVAETTFHHVCEVCGIDEILTPEAAFEAGWDYPPRMGQFGVISPRTCGHCGMNETVWWALTVGGTNPGMLTDTQRATIERINGEP